MTYPQMIILSVSVAGLFIAYHYLVVRPVNKEHPVNCYESDFNCLADMIDEIDTRARLRVVEKLIKHFREKYIGNAYVEYDTKKLEKRLENIRAIFQQELIMN